MKVKVSRRTAVCETESSITPLSDTTTTTTRVTSTRRRGRRVTAGGGGRDLRRIPVHSGCAGRRGNQRRTLTMSYSHELEVQGVKQRPGDMRGDVLMIRALGAPG